MKKSIYWSCDEVFCDQRLLNFIIGTRGVGKTYSFVEKGIKNYLHDWKKRKEEKRQMGYIRRYEVELDSIDTLFNPFKNSSNEIIKNCEFKVEGGTFYIKPPGEDKFDVLGFYMALSKSHQFKGSSYPNCTLIIYDEFMVEQGQRQLKGEVNKLFNLIETIARLREDISVCLLGNATSFNDSNYRWELNLQIPYKNSKWFHKTKSIGVYFVSNDAYIRQKKKTRFGKLVEGTSYEVGMIDNKMMYDSNTFIRKKKGNYNLLFTFLYAGSTFGVFSNNKNVIIDFCSNRPDFQIVDPESNVDSIKALKRTNPIVKKLRKYTEYGILYYQSQAVKAKLHKLFIKILY